ncbi:NfeD family protein [Bacillus sp. FJAT-42315]|uniref:NfeD family protein n=1 Tax=Bacillus sp. FJAT-42315 TaxID=2014077 RepID=UPI000C2395CD|nr:NfeD family protein [Bacillus sp. FJAT-42315]
MELFGFPIDTVYLFLLIASTSVTVLYILFGDVLGGADDGVPFFNPTVLLAFVTIFSAVGYCLEAFSRLESLYILLIAVGVAVVMDLLLYYFVLIPLSSAEESLVYTEESLSGRTGKVIIPIPSGGFGEVIIENSSGMISKPACAFDDQPIAEGTTVLIIEVQKGVLHVQEYDLLFQDQQ